MGRADVLPLLIGIHVALALALLLPSILLPFALRTRPAGHRPGPLTRGLVRLQRDYGIWVGLGLALTGAGLLAVVGPDLVRRPWLAIALVIYAANLVVAIAIQRPALRRLLRLSSDPTDADRQRWSDFARRQRYLSYVMAGAVGLIAFLMMTKPEF